MKFYEFNNYAYYALICAESEEQAVARYAECVSDIEDGNGPPEEMTLELAREKFLSCCTSDYDKQEMLEEFNRLISFNEPIELLIDGALI